MEKRMDLIAISYRRDAQYPTSDNIFYRPDTAYPEYMFPEVSPAQNDVYELVRNAFYLMGYDRENFGTPLWNPLGGIIYPGNRVLIKPNLVMDINRGEGGDVACLYTQPSVVAAVIDYVLLALKGTGKIVIGDAPMQECDLENLTEKSGYKKMMQFYKEKYVDIEFADFRELSSVVKKGIHYNEIHSNARGTVIDLKEQSEFASLNEGHLRRMRVTNYDPALLRQHHCAGKHEYFISDYVLKSDVVINMPKPKTHRKAGITCALKNLVGINVRKEFLPHHTTGAKSEGGDEYLKPGHLKNVHAAILDKMNHSIGLRKYRVATAYLYMIKSVRFLGRFLWQNDYREGSWYGNDTINRTIADLNKIFLYADQNGQMQPEPQRRQLIVADMIVSGEKEGPVMPSPKPVGMIAAGENSVSFDEVIATIMGAKPSQIPTIETAKKVSGMFRLWSPKIRPLIVSNDGRWNRKEPGELDKDSILNFAPAGGWKQCFAGPAHGKAEKKK